ncbi:phosphopantetheine-binding protein [Streptomyces sp. T12]|uniref:phosphopantetheine-binding protein n=1 Tax=Streptomyces sp. T12 TaxID=477697 RepID=UPI0023659E5C|nr:phosphopantetheine-binding protein [Streptomyces sp. T12]WDF41899.1 phosphopantetheine-binding protein [Streptomyces sp. T12]
MTDSAPWDSTFERLLRPFLRSFPEEASLQPDQNLTTAGLDSMGSVELLLTLEDHYAIQIPDELLQASTFATAGALWKVVSELSAGGWRG